MASHHPSQKDISSGCLISGGGAQSSDLRPPSTPIRPSLMMTWTMIDVREAQGEVGGGGLYLLNT